LFKQFVIPVKLLHIIVDQPLFSNIFRSSGLSTGHYIFATQIFDFRSQIPAATFEKIPKPFLLPEVNKPSTDLPGV
jgi:hypothetical protein